MRNVFKALTTEDWNKSQKSGYISTDLDEKDGFIHLSFANQLPLTLQLYFDNVQEIVLLKVDQKNLINEIIYENPNSSKRMGKFPHLYGKLPIENILNNWNIRKNAFKLPICVLLDAEKDT